MNSEGLLLICFNSDGINPRPSPISCHLSLKLCIRFKSVAMSLSVNTRSVGAIEQKYNHNTIARKLVGNNLEVKIICKYIFL